MRITKEEAVFLSFAINNVLSNKSFLWNSFPTNEDSINAMASFIKFQKKLDLYSIDKRTESGRLSRFSLDPKEYLDRAIKYIRKKYPV